MYTASLSLSVSLLLSRSGNNHKEAKKNTAIKRIATKSNKHSRQTSRQAGQAKNVPHTHTRTPIVDMCVCVCFVYTYRRSMYKQLLFL